MMTTPPAQGVQHSVTTSNGTRRVDKIQGFFGRLKQEFFHGRDFAGVTIKGFIERLDAYMTWYRDGRIKLTFGTSIAKRRRELGLMA
ncbi:IS3 family transposase [Bifidobacterium pullorum]|uniref:IS3 family transposase n=1 Tax=Bifidobacterium pullorum TaxID=78448 RepID=UPI0025A3B2E7|nr:IS3 family transposase [Bifidobacterium pullorum]MDM8323619.1 IS3 family transposase [Bifidobacterium pullorum]